MKKTWYIIMFGLIKKRFIGWSIVLVNEINQTKGTSLSNQKFKIQLTLTN